MLVATVSTVNQKYEVMGIVEGSSVQCKDMFRDIGQGLKSLVGGELNSYNKMMCQTRKNALAAMEKAATEMGADAVVGVRYSSTSVMQGASEICAYGTAIKYIKP